MRAPSLAAAPARLGLRLRQLALLVLALASLALLQPAMAAPCAPPTPLQAGDVVNVAVLVWIGGQPEGLYTGKLADTTVEPHAMYARVFSQPYMLGQSTGGGGRTAQRRRCLLSNCASPLCCSLASFLIAVICVICFVCCC